MSNLIELFNKEQELAQQLLELDESEHEKINIEKALNLKDMANSVDRYAWFFQLSDNKIEFLKACQDTFKKQIKSLELKQQYVKELIKNEMINNDYESVIGITKKINLQLSKLSMELDESKIPASYFKEVIVKELDRDKVMSELIRGDKVEGASLKQTSFIKVYNNSSNQTAQLIKGKANE